MDQSAVEGVACKQRPIEKSVDSDKKTAFRFCGCGGKTENHRSILAWCPYHHLAGKTTPDFLRDLKHDRCSSFPSKLVDELLGILKNP